MSSQDRSPLRHRIALIETDDWVRVYVDGKFYGEGHSLEGVGGTGNGLLDLLRVLGIQMGSEQISQSRWEKHMYDDDDQGEAYFDRCADQLLARMKREEPD